MNNITIKRMKELEKMVNNVNNIYSLNLDEIKYLERAIKIPYSEVRNDMIKLGEIVLPIAQIRCIYYLLAKYNCTESELNERFMEVDSLRQYDDSINNKLLKEQKRMVKRMNNI